MRNRMNRAEMIEVARGALWVTEHFPVNENDERLPSCDHPDYVQMEVMTFASAESVVDALIAAAGDESAVFRVGRNAPETSKAIVDKVRDGTLQAAMLYLFNVERHPHSFHQTDGWTDDELEQRMGRTHQSVSATRNTLMRKGYVVDSGLRRKTRSGNDAIVYVWTGKEQVQ